MADALNKGLQCGDIMAVFPVFMVFWMGFSVLSGLVFYHRETPGPLMLVGFGSMLAGVVLFVQHDRLVDTGEKRRLVLARGKRTAGLSSMHNMYAYSYY